jgi:hypothetical protein
MERVALPACPLAIEEAAFDGAVEPAEADQIHFNIQ